MKETVHVTVQMATVGLPAEVGALCGRVAIVVQNNWLSHAGLIQNYITSLLIWKLFLAFGQLPQDTVVDYPSLSKPSVDVVA